MSHLDTLLTVGFEATDYDDLCHIYGPSIWDGTQITIEEKSRSASEVVEEREFFTLVSFAMLSLTNR